MALKKPTKAVPPTGGVVVPGVVSAFAALFQGWSKAYGVTDMTNAKRDERGKLQGKSWTEKGAPTPEVYARHLAGKEPGVGIFMLRDDDTCLFGAIDFDKYSGMAHAKAEEAVKRLGLPLIVCKSKSTGGHFFVFLKEPVDAGLLRDKLDEWKAKLGMSAKTETFPKQSARHSAADFGSWINLPYFGGDATERYAIIDGQPASLGVFLEAARTIAIGPEELAVSGEAPEDLFYEGPPCLQVILGQGGFEEGTRNDGMMGVAVYLKKRFGDAWQAQMDKYNRAMGDLPAEEVVDLTKKNKKKDYTYACKRSPLNAFCQRRLCLRREYGVGDGPDDAKGHQITALTRYDSSATDEPMWGMEINGRRVMVSNSAFYSRDEFNKSAMAQANVLPIHMTPARWLRHLSELIATADVVQTPEDAGPTGQLWQWVEGFTTQRVAALEKEEILLGKPYRAEGKVYFRSQDLFKYLDARRVKYPSTQAVWQLLRAHNATKEEWNMRGKFANVWCLEISAAHDDDGPAPVLPMVPDDEF